jgi:hypothetical protein
MKNRVSTICFAAILLISFSVVRVSDAAGTTIYVNPAKSTAWPLNTAGGHGYNNFQVEIKVSDVVDLFGWNFWFHWNPAVVNLTSYLEGSFIKGPFNYETYPKANSKNISVTNPTYAYDKDTATYANLTYGREVALWYDCSPTDYNANITVTTPLRAFDKNNSTKASLTYAQGTVDANYGNFTMLSFESQTGQILQVDLKMRFNATAASDDQYRIVYYVSPSTAKQVLLDWTSAAQPLSTVTWANRAEPNDGTWSWTDVNNINFMIETKRVGASDNKRIDVWEAWASVKAGSSYGGYALGSFGIPLRDYPIDRVDLKMRYSAEAAVDDQYRIAYYVQPDIADKRVLQAWTSASKALDTYTWSRLSEPVDGVWSWTDVSNINFEVGTHVVGASDNKQIRVYEAWAVVKYHRETFTPSPSIDYTLGYLFYGSTVVGSVDGASGTGTIAILRFVAKTSGASVLQFVSSGPTPYTKLLDSGGNLITHTRVDGSFSAPPWTEDINGDGYVDIQDIALVGIGWGKTSADPNWSKYKDADVNKDNKIDASDLSAVALKWSYGSYL